MLSSKKSIGVSFFLGVKTMALRIIRRAFSDYHLVEIFNGTWLEAEMRAMDLQFQKQDGEYLVRPLEGPIKYNNPSPYIQSSFDFL